MNCVDCRAVTLDFILLDGDATAAALEDDIATDLAKVGITVNARSGRTYLATCYQRRCKAHATFLPAYGRLTPLLDSRSQVPSTPALSPI